MSRTTLQIPGLGALAIGLSAVTAPAQTTLEWETTISVTSDIIEGGDELVIDPAGNAIVMGYLAVEQDFYLLKFDPAGTLLWSRVIGGSAMDNPGGLVVDEAGDLYIAGRTLSSDFPTAAALQATKNGPSDAFLMKLDGQNGNTLFSTYFGGSRGEWAYGIALGDDGTITVAGATDSTDLPTVNAVQSGLTLVHCFCDDAFVTQFTPQGDAILFSTYLGGAFDDLANEVGVDAGGNIFVAGRSKSDDFPTFNAVQPTHGGGDFDAFVARIDADRTLNYSTYLGGEDDELVQGLAVTAAGDAYLTGSTRSIGFPTTAGAFQESYVGGLNACEVPFGADLNCYDMFVTHLESDGLLGYSTYLGGTHTDEPRNIVVDDWGRAHVVGYTFSQDFPLSVPFGQVVAMQLSADGGNVNFAITHDTPNANAGSAVAVSGDALYLTAAVGLPYDTYLAKYRTPSTRGDGDGDGDMDLDDYIGFAPCLKGPGGGMAAGCGVYDMDDDGEITLVDVARFQADFTGN